MQGWGSRPQVSKISGLNKTDPDSWHGWFYLCLNQCCGYFSFWYGSGTDLDPRIAFAPPYTWWILRASHSEIIFMKLGFTRSYLMSTITLHMKWCLNNSYRAVFYGSRGIWYVYKSYSKHFGTYFHSCHIFLISKKYLYFYYHVFGTAIFWYVTIWICLL